MNLGFHQEDEVVEEEEGGRGGRTVLGSVSGTCNISVTPTVERPQPTGRR